MTILFRLSKGVREQNGFAVVVEFIIVVAGVAVGFQLSQDYDRAQTATREASYQRLLICRVEAKQSAGFNAVTAFDTPTMAEAEGVREGLINRANYHRATARVVGFPPGAVEGALNRLADLDAYTPSTTNPTCLYGPQPTAAPE